MVMLLPRCLCTQNRFPSSKRYLSKLTPPLPTSFLPTSLHLFLYPPSLLPPSSHTYTCTSTLPRSLFLLQPCLPLLPISPFLPSSCPPSPLSLLPSSLFLSLLSSFPSSLPSPSSPAIWQGSYAVYHHMDIGVAYNVLQRLNDGVLSREKISI